MSWTIVIWSMVASACLTLALTHFLIWLRHPVARLNLALFTAAVSVAALAACEWFAMHSTSTTEFATMVRWGHVPVAIIVTSIVAFVYLYFGTGTVWLGVASVAMRALALVMNFTVPVNLNYREVTSLGTINFFGEEIASGMGVPNPWMITGQLSSLFALIFVVDASIRLWRRGGYRERKRAFVVGGGIIFFLLTATVHSALLHTHVIASPYFISIPFMAIILAMHYELSHDMFRSTQIARQLRESEQSMAIAADAANMGMWVWELTTNDIWITEKGRELYGFPHGMKVTQADFLERIHPGDLAARNAAARHAIETRGEYSIEYRVLMPDGSLRWMNIRGRCMDEGPDAPTRLLGVCMDITAQKNADAEAKQHQEELTHLSRVATIGSMATALAHELNQPLTGIITNASAGRRFITKGNTDMGKLDGLLDAVVADGRRASDIIQGIRGMVRKTGSTRTHVNLNNVIAEVILFAHFDAEGRGCKIFVEPDTSLPMVEGDPVQLQQVVLNLLMNAYDAMREMPEAERRIIIQTSQEPDGRVQASVRDFGKGLSSDDAGRIFEQFYSTKPGGMGMGLAIAHSIIASHGGTISAGNAEPTGACLRFSLPAIREAA